MKRTRLQPSVPIVNELSNIQESPNELLVNCVDGELDDNSTMLVGGKLRKNELCLLLFFKFNIPY